MTLDDCLPDHIEKKMVRLTCFFHLHVVIDAQGLAWISELLVNRVQKHTIDVNVAKPFIPPMIIAKIQQWKPSSRTHHGFFIFVRV